MKFKKIIAGLVSMAVVCSVASCGGGESSDIAKDPSSWESLKNLAAGEVVEINVAGRDVATEKTNYQNFINQFNSQQNKVIAHLDWYDTPESYNIALDGMGKNLPDVFMVSNAAFISYASAKKLAPIEDYVDSGIRSDMYDDGVEAYYFDHGAKKTGYTDSANLYGLPKDQGPFALAYNTDLLVESVDKYNATAKEEDKIDINRVTSTTSPMTFEYFLEVGEKLKTVLPSGKYVCSGYDLQSNIYSNNASFFTDDTASKANISSENFVEAVEFVQDMYKKEILPKAGTVTNGETQFTAGNSIFYYKDAGPWKTKDYWLQCTSFTFDILPVMVGPAEGAVSTAQLGGMCYSISAQSKYKDAALMLVEFLAADPASQRTQYARGQCIPNLKSLTTEYITDSESLIANASSIKEPTPAHRSVWVDSVDKYGESKTDADGNSYTDVVTGKYKIESYTLNDIWLKNLMAFMGGDTKAGDLTKQSFWEADKSGNFVDVAVYLKAYESYMQADLDLLNKALERL